MKDAETEFQKYWAKIDPKPFEDFPVKSMWLIRGVVEKAFKAGWMSMFFHLEKIKTERN